VKLSARPSAELVQWAAARIPELHGREFLDTVRAMGVEDNSGRLLGVVTFHNWDPDAGTMQVSAAADDARWLLARGAIASMREYVFVQCGCQKIWSITPRSNLRALRLVKALGLWPEAILKRQLGADDAVISRQFREEIYGQEIQTASAA
jgi:hypothetical protein